MNTYRALINEQLSYYVMIDAKSKEDAIRLWHDDTNMNRECSISDTYNEKTMKTEVKEVDLIAHDIDIYDNAR